MIVKIAACLYILQAALCLASLTLLPFGFSASMENLVTLLLSGLLVAIGVGLLKRTHWARWLALGNSLIGWTLGTLLLVVMIGGAIFLSEMLGAMAGGGLGTVFGVLILVVAAVFIASIVISFKLYFYLRSEAGAQEFGVEPESFGSVMGSVGVWFAIAVVQGMFTGGSAGSYFPTAGSDEDFAETTAEFQEFDQDADVARQLEAQESDGAEAGAEGEITEQEGVEVAADTQSEESTATAPQETHAEEEAELPVQQAAAPVSGSESLSAETSRNQILKCRDASGAMQYTQGYCPPGTTRVEMPSN